MRLVILYKTGIWIEGDLAVGEGVERIYGLVRRFALSQSYHNLSLFCGEILHLSHFNLPFVIGGHNALAYIAGVFAKRKLCYLNCLFVCLYDSCSYRNLAASFAVCIS